MLAQENGEASSTDLLQDVGNEVKVTLDRWSVGQLDASDVAIAGIVLVTGFVLAWLSTRIARSLSRRSTGAVRAAVATTGLLVGSAVVTLACAVALEVLGFGLGPILVLVVLLVIALVLLRPVVTNLGSGVLLQLRGALEAGDLIATCNTLGTVHEINARSVVLDTSDGRRVHIPNQEVLRESIENFTVRGQRRSTMELLVDTERDLPAAVDAITSAVTSCPAVAAEPPPTVEITGLVGRYAAVRVRVWHEWTLAAGNAAIDQATTSAVDALTAVGVSLRGPELLALPTPADGRAST